MESWKDSILTSLIERDKREKSLNDIISAYTRLASRTASVESRLSALQSYPPPSHPTSFHAPGSGLPEATSNTSAPPRTGSQTNLPLTLPTANSGTLDPIHSNTVVLQQLRADLLEAQKTKSQLNATLTTLQAAHTQLVATHQTCTATITKLTTERDTCRKKLDTREEEMRFKNKQVERLQDDIMAYEMQLNLLHQQKDDLQKQYDDLLQRMMKYKQKEAEELISNSKYS